eukprot:COSAG02_NODE_2982_length_7621_cov_3.542808_4_plen_36_part_00
MLGRAIRVSIRVTVGPGAGKYELSMQNVQLSKATF